MAAGYYTAARWGEQEWRQFGRETGTSDILSSHPRLYRSLSFGDDDYADAAFESIGRVLDEGVGGADGEAQRMEVLAPSMPDLPEWVAEHAPNRVKDLFREYLDARDPSEVPTWWLPTEQEATNEVFPFPDATNEVFPSSPSVTSSEPDSWALPADEVDSWAVSDVPRAETPEPAPPPAGTPAAAPAVQSADRQIFVVHGHDEAALNSIRVYVHRVTGTMPLSLAEEAGGAMTIIEKFESYGAKTGYVIVLLTPDDVGETVADYDAGVKPSPRARQNVVLELGYFLGTLGRKQMVVVNAGVEKPSDIAGVGYVQYPGSNWKDDLRKELVEAKLVRP